MKILMLNYEFPPIGGGGGKAHLNLLREYARCSNLQVDVLTSSPEPNHSIEPFSDRIVIHKVGIHKKSLHYWRKLEVLEWLFKARRFYIKLIGQTHYDLIHAFFAFPSGYLCLKTAGQIPYIVSLRGSDVPGFNVRLKLDYHLLKGTFRKIWRNADAVIANSKGLAELASAFEPSLDIGVICNGINTEHFKPHTIQSPASPVRLLTVCRLIARKRIHVLIETIAHLKERGVNAQLNVVGEGNLLNALKAHAAQAGVSDQVHFPGLVVYEQMPGIYQQNDFFVMSSAHEGMSNAMLEAMASGLPVISTACEGTGELIRDNGILVDDCVPEVFADAVCQILNTDQYCQMSRASQETALRFSWQASANHYIDLYQKICKTSSSL